MGFDVDGKTSDQGRAGFVSAGYHIVKTYWKGQSLRWEDYLALSPWSQSMRMLVNQLKESYE